VTVPEASLGIIAFSAESSPLDDAEQVVVETPYGPTSAPIHLGEVDGVPVAFLARHGDEGQIPPQRIPYRANVWAMREVGVRRIVAPVVCGALTLDHDLGDMIVCDQFVDRTWGREDTYYDGSEGTVMVSAARPFCEELGSLLVRVGHDLGFRVRDGGTTVVIPGPRFSTIAESLFFRGMGWDLVNMVTYPESHLARELELCYANLSVVTDHDVGLEGVGGVTSQTVTRVMADSADHVRRLLRAAMPEIGPQPDDECATALTRARL
jgi:5'-methylthioadenosine phosphorylase